MNRKILLTAIATVGLGVMASASMANTVITATLIGMELSNPETGKVYGGDALGGVNAFIGELKFQGNSINDPIPFQSFFGTYCVDLSHDISPGGVYTFTEEPNLGSALGDQGNSDAVNEITQLYLNDLPGWTTTPNNVADNPTTEAAFQLAIWDIVYDDAELIIPTDHSLPFSIDSSVDGAAVTQAETWLAALSSESLGTGNNSFIGLQSLKGSQGQSFIDIGNFGAPFIGVPLPAASNEMIVLLGAMGLLRFARRAKKLA